MHNKELAEYLDSRSVGYRWSTHPAAFTAKATAECSHVPGEKFAKTVIVRLNGKMAMTVLPATEKLSFRRLKDTAGVNDVRLASEQEFANRFPGCENGAMPPFGSLYGMPVFVSKTLTEDDEIAFNAGTHTELVTLSYHDYARMEHPRIGDFTA